jgi:hypothetical protein
MKPAISASSRGAAELLQRGVDAVAEVLRRIDEGAVEVEDEKLEALDRNRSKDVDHDSSVTRGQGSGVRDQGSGFRSQGTEKREKGTGNREQGTVSGDQWTGIRKVGNE